jgi:hypothetical protein
VPWSLWRGHHHIESQDIPPLHVVLHVHFLTHASDRLPRAFTGLFDQLSHQGNWAFLVPCFLAVAIVAAIRGPARREAAFYLAVATVYFLGLVVIYWIGYLEIDYWILNSSDRTVSGIVYISAVGLAHIGGRLLPARVRPDPAPT